jgi:hypothetical protein
MKWKKVMAFKTLNSQINAIALGDGKDGTVKTLQGHVTAVELNKGTRKNSSIYSLQQPDGSLIKVWGSQAIDSSLLTGDPKNRVIADAVLNCLVRLTHVETREFGSGKKKQSFKDIKVELDSSDQLKSSKRTLRLGASIKKQMDKTA